MDYHSIHGQDISSFDLPSTHRLPIVSAADALDDLDENPERFVSTGLMALDEALAPVGGSESTVHGGVQRGHITEIWGPPGVGKTAFGIELACNALLAGKSVVWVDVVHPISQSRITETCIAKGKGSPLASTGRLSHFIIRSLAHFIALLCRPTPTAIPRDTTLVVVDSLAALINHDYPRTVDLKSRNRMNQELAARRVQVIQYILGALQKLAATKDIAIVLLTQCATKMQSESGATLIPAINATAWDQGIASRLVLFKDWIWQDGSASSGSFAGIQKLNGKNSPEAISSVVGFAVGQMGIRPLRYIESQMSVTLSTTPQKRKPNSADFEIADSEDEGYGWDDDDEEALLRMPTQWQGSEDILLGRDGRDEDQDGDEDEGKDGDDGDDETNEETVVENKSRPR